MAKALPATKEHREGQLGMTLIELTIAVGLVGLVVAGTLVAFRSFGRASANQQARAHLQDHVTTLEARLRKVFMARSSYQLTADGLSITRHGADSDFASLYTTDVQTSCSPLPPNHQLSSTAQANVAGLLPCAPCPVGQRPILTITDSATGNSQIFPAAGQGGLLQQPVAAGLCPSAVATGVSLLVYIAVVNQADDGTRSIVPINHEQLLSVQSAANHVQILH